MSTSQKKVGSTGDPDGAIEGVPLVSGTCPLKIVGYEPCALGYELRALMTGL